MSNDKSAAAPAAKPAEATAPTEHVSVTIDQVIDQADAQRAAVAQAAKEAGIGFWNQKAPFMEQTTRGELASQVAVGIGLGLAAYGTYRLVKDIFFSEGPMVVGLSDSLDSLL
ncbi:MAG TPA: hypothetical protein VN081_05090 [Dongiaceae bacterium]|nr:hypothetical protein [Dongiaceae bacterium]